MLQVHILHIRLKCQSGNRAYKGTDLLVGPVVTKEVVGGKCCIREHPDCSATVSCFFSTRSCAETGLLQNASEIISPFH